MSQIEADNAVEDLTLLSAEFAVQSALPNTGISPTMHCITISDCSALNAIQISIAQFKMSNLPKV